MIRFILGLLLMVNYTISHAQIITTIGGIGSSGFAGDGGPATAARLFIPQGVAVDYLGNIFIADANNNRIRKINTNGIISTVAGTIGASYNGDNIPATSANLYGPLGVAPDWNGNIYVADFYNNRIRKIDSLGMITTVAGNGYTGVFGDGDAATSATLYYPSGVAVDRAGNLYIADCYNHRIRKVNTSGIITTIAGISTSQNDYGFSGDGGPAVDAKLRYPYGIVVDRNSNIFFSDRDNHRIRKIDTNGIISTVAGNGVAGYGVLGSIGNDGDSIPAIQAKLNYPLGLAIDSSGNLIIADKQNNRIRKVNTNGMITTIAGNGYNNFSGDGGLARLAEMSSPGGVAILGNDTVIIADAVNSRIRKTPSLPVRFCVGSGTTITSDIGGGTYNWQQQIGNGTFQNIFDNSNFSGTLTNTLLLKNIPGSWYGYKYRSKAGSNYSRLFTITFSNTWIGSVSNEWENAANWSCGTVPEANTDVIVNSGSILISANTTVRSLIAKPGVNITINPGVVFTVLK